jgi:hypothetical protein
LTACFKKLKFKTVGEKEKKVNFDKYKAQAEAL